MLLKVSSVKWPPFWPGWDELIHVDAIAPLLSCVQASSLHSRIIEGSPYIYTAIIRGQFPDQCNISVPTKTLPSHQTPEPASLQTESYLDANFVDTGGTAGCRYDNLRYCQWQQSWYLDNS